MTHDPFAAIVFVEIGLLLKITPVEAGFPFDPQSEGLVQARFLERLV